MDFVKKVQLAATPAPSSGPVWEPWDMFVLWPARDLAITRVKKRENRGTRSNIFNQSWPFCILAESGARPMWAAAQIWAGMAAESGDYDVYVTDCDDLEFVKHFRPQAVNIDQNKISKRDLEQ